MRPSTHTLVAAAAISLLAAGCTSSTEPFVDPGALAAAQTFDRIADSLSNADAEPPVSSAYREVARVVRRGSALSSVIIAVDGAPAEYLATALSFDQNYCPPGAYCALSFVYLPPVNSVIAWQRSDPRRIVQLTADADMAIGTTMPGYTDLAPFRHRATLTYLDGTGGIYLGTGGTQAITVTPSEQTCASPTAPPEASYTLPPVQCRLATFDVSFTGTVQPPPFDLRRNTASGTHTIAMAAQTVSGVQLSAVGCGACDLNAPPLSPPIAIDATSRVLQPTLTATASGRDVTLTFTVKNVSAAAVQLDFTSAQQYDFIVRNVATGAKVWQWSATMSFAATLTSRTLAPGETAAFTEQWHAPAAGMYGVEALLTSRSHLALAYVPINVP
jgi:hypothetical protein